jgi:hypothetical protein
MCLKNFLEQRLFNFKDDNASINQLLSPLEVGHDVDTGEKAYRFVKCEMNMAEKAFICVILGLIISKGIESASGSEETFCLKIYSRWFSMVL